MMKRLLTILSLISCYVLFGSWKTLCTKEIEIIYSPCLTQKFISPYVWQIDCDVAMKELKITTQQNTKKLEYTVDYVSPKRALVKFCPPPTGWFSEVWLSVFTSKLKHEKKIFLELANPDQAQLKIISFSPTFGKKHKQSLELIVEKEGSLAGLCLQIDLPKKYKSVFYLPDIYVKYSHIWQVEFCDQKELSVDSTKKVISLPCVLSKTSALITLIEKPQAKIQDLLIYRTKPCKNYNGWGTKNFEIAIESLKSLPNFPYPLQQTSDYVLLTKGIRTKEKLIRKSLQKPFTKDNTDIHKK